MTILAVSKRKLPSAACELGEGPHYDSISDSLFWFDIVGKKLLEHRFQTEQVICHDLPRMASVIARIDDDQQLLAMDDGLYLRRRDSGALSLYASLEAENSSTRSNDGRVHPSGRLWIGTMGRKAEWQAGSIYVFDGSKFVAVARKVTIPNSICFSPDGRTGYFADTAVNKIWRVDLDPQTALPRGEPELFIDGSSLPLGGHFDGSVVDADGVLWNAAWGGGSISGFAPDGSLVRTFEVPAAQTSCPCFVGRSFDRMAVTSAWQGYSDAQRASDPGAGFTYLIDGGFKGVTDSLFLLTKD